MYNPPPHNRLYTAVADHRGRWYVVGPVPARSADIELRDDHGVTLRCHWALTSNPTVTIEDAEIVAINNSMAEECPTLPTS